MYSRQEYAVVIALFNSRFVRGILVLVVLTLGWKVLVSTGEYMVWRRQEQVATAEHAKLISRSEALQRELTQLESLEGREGIVRKQFVVKRPGEQTVIVVDGSATSSDTEEITQPWYRRIFSWMHFGN